MSEATGRPLANGGAARYFVRLAKSETMPDTTASETARPTWSKPGLRRLGTVRDIAQPGANLDQGASGKGVPIAS